MFTDFGIAMDSISLAQVLMGLLGGFLFGMSLYCIKPRTPSKLNVVLHYNNFILSMLVMLYITFPFAQGLLGLIERGNAVVLFDVSFTYIIYMIGFVLSSIVYWFIEKKVR